MATGDGLLVRVKPPLGRIPAEAMRVLADAAEAHGNGAVELTGRGALQFRGLTAASAERFAAVAVGLGLAVAGSAAERRRSVLVSPLAGLDPAVAPATMALASELEAASVSDHGLAGLPAKFGFAVDGGGMLPLGAGADVTLVLGAERCWVVPEGADEAAEVEPDEAVGAMLRVAHGFLAVAAGERRMRAVDARRVLAAAGLRRQPWRAGSSPAMTPCGVGALPGAFGAGVPFGSMDAATLRALAGLAHEVRLTPWRSVLLPGLTDPGPLAALGLIVSADDPRLLVSACVGEPGCASASVPTRAVAAGLRPTVTVHVSGCSKGCAHPGPAALTFVGRDGRFDLVRNGRAGDLPIQHGLLPAELMAIR